jgi:hypothetical protein
MSAVLSKEMLNQDHSAPTIAIEIVSPDDLAEAVMDKVLFIWKTAANSFGLFRRREKQLRFIDRTIPARFCEQMTCSTAKTFYRISNSN